MIFFDYDSCLKNHNGIFNIFSVTIIGGLVFLVFALTALFIKPTENM